MPSKWLYQGQCPKFATFSPAVLILHSLGILKRHVQLFVCFNSKLHNNIECWICLIYLLVNYTFSWRWYLFNAYFLIEWLLFILWSFVHCIVCSTWKSIIIRSSRCSPWSVIWFCILLVCFGLQLFKLVISILTGLCFMNSVSDAVPIKLLPYPESSKLYHTWPSVS